MRRESLFSADELAKHLGIKRETVYVWMETRNMPAQKVGRLWKFNLSEVENGCVPGRPE